MIRVGLARTEPSYAGLEPPYGPGADFPELQAIVAESERRSTPNPVYAGVRAALAALGLDAARWGTPAWNPLGDLVAPGGRIVLKPNFIRHWNPHPDGTVQSVITHGSVIRAVADYAFLAAGPTGSVTLAEAPQHDCDFDEIRRVAGLDALERHYRESAVRELAIVDLRRERVEYRDGVIVARRALPGDPRGYRAVDLGEASFFHDSGLDPARMRGADYDPGPTTEHHREGRNEYLLSETALSCDLLVNLPKLKTHKKTGVTLALKNLVGINGDKNWLPHHCVGPPSSGGDEFPGDGLVDLARSRATEVARRLLARGVGTRALRAARRLEFSVRGDDFVRSGNWHGNRTTWRMCLDLNRCVYYSDGEGLHLDAGDPVRRVLTLIDGVVAGEGEGPLSPRDRPLGVLLAATDPVALDLVAVRLMGFHETGIPKIRECMRAPAPRISNVRSADEVVVVEADAKGFHENPLDSVRCERPFLPHSGWAGHLGARAA